MISQFFPLLSHYLLLAVLGSMAIVCATHAEEPKARPKLDEKHAEKMAQGLQLFTERVRGVLVARCLECHGGEETEGDFDLSTRPALLEGGAEGAAIQPGNAKASRLMKLIRHELAPEMPFDEAKLEDDEIAAIAK